VSTWRDVSRKAAICSLPVERRWHDGEVSQFVDAVIGVSKDIEASLDLFDPDNASEYALCADEALTIIKDYPVGYLSACGCFTFRQRWT